MTRLLQGINLFGLCAVALLCGLQWRSIARIDADRDRLELLRQSQRAQIDRETKTIADQAADLEDFRTRLTMAESQLKDLQNKLNDAITARDQLQKFLDQWKAAVASRDAALKQAGAEIQTLSAARNDAIARFNDVAVKYNDLVKKTTQ